MSCILPVASEPLPFAGIPSTLTVPAAPRFLVHPDRKCHRVVVAPLVVVQRRR